MDTKLVNGKIVNNTFPNGDFEMYNPIKLPDLEKIKVIRPNNNEAENSKLKKIDNKSKTLQTKFEDAIVEASHLKEELQELQDKRDKMKNNKSGIEKEYNTNIE